MKRRRRITRSKRDTTACLAIVRELRVSPLDWTLGRVDEQLSRLEGILADLDARSGTRAPSKRKQRTTAALAAAKTAKDQAP